MSYLFLCCQVESAHPEGILFHPSVGLASEPASKIKLLPEMSLLFVPAKDWGGQVREYINLKQL